MTVGHFEKEGSRGSVELTGYEEALHFPGVDQFHDLQGHTAARFYGRGRVVPGVDTAVEVLHGRGSKNQEAWRISDTG